jgi:hypothetical protein
VTVADFNEPNSALTRSTIAATKRLNSDSNRLPELTKQPTNQRDKPPQNTGDRAKQQVKNIAGGAASAVTSTMGTSARCPSTPSKRPQVWSMASRSPPTSRPAAGSHPVRTTA